METPEKKTRRRYSEREKAAALAVYDATGNLSEASRISGIPDSTIHGWLSEKPSIVNSDVPLLRQGYERSTESLADKFETIAHLCTDEISTRLQDSNKVHEIPMPHLIKAAEVSVDKSQLLNSRPTQIIEERVDVRAVLVLMSTALGIEDIEQPQPPFETEGRLIEGA